MRRIVLGCSGAVDDLIAIPWLADHYQAEVVAVTLDVGQRAELVAIREQALALGALRSHVIDARDEFGHGYILPALHAGALAPELAPAVTALARPLVIDKLVGVARMENATAIAHGSRSSIVHAEFVSAARSLDPSCDVLAAAQSWTMTGAEAREYARSRNIPESPQNQMHHSAANLWGRSVVVLGGSDDPWLAPPSDIYTMTRSAQESPDQPAYLEIEFEGGVPVRANGIEMPFLEMIESLEIIGGTHGVGRTEHVTAGADGVARLFQETPAGTILQIAHAALQRMVVSPDLEQIADELALGYSRLMKAGRWLRGTREPLDMFVSTIQKRVTGAVKLRLFKGDCRVVGRRSPHARTRTPLPAADAEASVDGTAARINEER